MVLALKDDILAANPDTCRGLIVLALAHVWLSVEEGAMPDFEAGAQDITGHGEERGNGSLTRGGGVPYVV